MWERAIGSAKQTLRGEMQQMRWRKHLQFAVDDIQVFFPTLLQPAHGNKQNRVLWYANACILATPYKEVSLPIDGVVTAI